MWPEIIDSPLKDQADKAVPGHRAAPAMAAVLDHQHLCTETPLLAVPVCLGRSLWGGLNRAKFSPRRNMASTFATANRQYCPVFKQIWNFCHRRVVFLGLCCRPVAPSCCFELTQSLCPLCSGLKAWDSHPPVFVQHFLVKQKFVGRENFF